MCQISLMEAGVRELVAVNLFVGQQHVLNKVCLHGNAHKTRFPIDAVVENATGGLQESNLYLPLEQWFCRCSVTLQTVTTMGRETWLDTWNILFRGLHFVSPYTVNVFSGHFIILRLSSKTQFTGSLLSENWDE